MTQNTKQLNVRITPELYQALDNLAHDNRKSLSAFLRDKLKTLAEI